MSIVREIARKASTDSAFRTQLLQDPKAAIAKTFNTKLPETVAVRVHENTESELHLVLGPPVDLATTRKLNDQELQQVTGGVMGLTAKTPGSYSCRTMK